MSRKHLTPEIVDAILPQTQCGLCTYKSCMPYAEAIVFENAPINLCPPGGKSGLLALAELVNEDPSSLLTTMQEKPRTRAVIREDECIGCTKCIQACPVDAILGSTKQMHTVIAAECTGCELCLTPCPVDCIDLVAVPTPLSDKTKQKARERFNARADRLKSPLKTKPCTPNAPAQIRKEYIAAALERVKNKKKML